MLTDLLTIPLNGPAAREDASPSPCAPGNEFLAGPENSLAATAAAGFEESQFEGSAPFPNPLVLYGPAAVGKTLLAQGLADRYRAAHPEDRVLVTNGHDFARDFALAVSANATDDFTRQQRKCRLLVIDDLEELAEKTAAQESLLHTFDALARRQALVIVTLHACPGEGTKLSSHLVSRLLGGLVVPLMPPTSATRQKVVEYLASQLGAHLDAAATQLLVDHPGATLAKLKFIVEQLAKQAAGVNGAAVQTLLANEGEAPASTLTISQIAAAIAKQFHLRQTVLKSTSRRATVVLARGLAMLAARRFCHLSYQEIGRHFGRRDHTTVLHACRKLENSLASDPVVAASWRQLLLDLNLDCEGAKWVGKPSAETADELQDSTA